MNTKAPETMPQRFTKKPVTIEAYQWHGDVDPKFNWPHPLPQEFQDAISGFCVGGPAFITTLEGTMQANIGDWLIKGVKGEIYPCKPDIFEATYTAAASPEPIEVGDESTSDGYHTFKELYEHRHALFIRLANADDRAWKSVRHNDGSEWDGWFIAGIDFESGGITYHLPNRLWKNLTCKELNRAPEWDGHTSDDVIKRLSAPEQRQPVKYNETKGAQLLENGKLGCFDCGRPYGDEHGFPDLVIPDDDWKKISPQGHEGGLLCPSCIVGRLEDKNIRTSGYFASGPLRQPVDVESLRKPLPCGCNLRGGRCNENQYAKAWNAALDAVQGLIASRGRRE